MVLDDQNNSTQFLADLSSAIGDSGDTAVLRTWRSSFMQHRLIGYTRSSYLACTVALVVTLGCGQSSPTDDGLCGGQECRAGEFCISGVCEQLCSADGTCSAGFSCRDGICVPVACGDGEVEGSEECDNGVDNDDNGACTRRCEEARCGDGLEFFEQEECDDSNAIDGDGCDSNCTLTACGNGIQTEGEECDDGNTDDTDGCRSDCVFSVCSAATPDGTPCTDDGVFCNGQEVCQQGECVSSGSPCVEDNLSCTTELCDEEAGLCNLIDAESCLVGGTCFDDGERSSVSRCYVCDAARNQSELTTLGDGLGLANPLYANDEGKVAGQACGVGVCAGFPWKRPPNLRAMLFLGCVEDCHFGPSAMRRVPSFAPAVPLPRLANLL